MVDYFYETVSEAVNALQARGYTIDFNTGESSLLNPADFEIVEVHRYEGDTDPADEAVVYALESKTGKKGLFVSGFGISADSAAAALLAKLHFHKEEGKRPR